MAIHLIDSNTITPINATTSDDTWIIAEGVYVATSDTAIYGAGSNGNKTFHIDGHVISSTDNAILLGSLVSGGGDNEVFISATGSMAGGATVVRSFGGSLHLTNFGSISATQTSSFESQGIEAWGGSNTITNGGTITAVGHAVEVFGLGNTVLNTGLISSLAGQGIRSLSGSNVVTNEGTISTALTGIVLFDGGNHVTNTGVITTEASGVSIFDGNNTVVNAGTITTSGNGIVSGGNGDQLINTGVVTATLSSARAVYMSTDIGEATVLVNQGTLSAPETAVAGLFGEHTIINQGTINGHVRLGSGTDTFNGRGGVTNGSVFGGAGDDIYIVDDPDIGLIENADEGHDTVWARSGFQLGDNFEDLSLIGDGSFAGIGNGLANTIRGNLADNLLDGGGGADIIQGGGGNDTILGGLGGDKLSGGSGDDQLRGGKANDTLAGGEGEDRLIGGNGNDRLFGGDDDDVLIGGNGNDRLVGGDDDDVLIGGMGRDVLIGSSGADRFVFSSALESVPGAARDLISDFTPAAGDRIDLSGIDADVSTGVDDGFTFIGTAQFSGSAGELRYFVNNGGHAIVRGDIDGDGSGDLEIVVLNTSPLTAGDFLL